MPLADAISGDTRCQLTGSEKFGLRFAFYTAQLDKPDQPFQLRPPSQERKVNLDSERTPERISAIIQPDEPQRVQDSCDRYRRLHSFDCAEHGADLWASGV